MSSLSQFEHLLFEKVDFFLFGVCAVPLLLYPLLQRDVCIYQISLFLAPLSNAIYFCPSAPTPLLYFFYLLCVHDYFWILCIVIFPSFSLSIVACSLFPREISINFQKKKCKSRIKNQESRIKNQKSKIKNQKSKIKNQKSKIKNQKSIDQRIKRRKITGDTCSRLLLL